MRPLALAALLLTGCGPAAALDTGRDAGPSCIAAGADAFCDERHPCCDGAVCDPANRVCRDPRQCGADGAGCGGELACCAGLSCVDQRCTQPASPEGPATGGAGGAGATTGGAMTGGLTSGGAGGLSGGPTIGTIGGTTTGPGPRDEGGRGWPGP